MISFVGAGPGAADLISLRGADRLHDADVVVWAASLVPAALLDHCRADVEVHDSKRMTFAEVCAVYAEHPDAAIVRLHSGDPAVYSAIGEQIAWCRANGRAFEIVPGVSALGATAAAAGCELTVPGVAESVVLTRFASGTSASMPAGETIAAYAATGTTLALFLSAGLVDRLAEQLLAPGSGYGLGTPVVVGHRVSWPDERIVRTTIGRLAADVRRAAIDATALILVGPALAGAADGDIVDSSAAAGDIGDIGSIVVTGAAAGDGGGRAARRSHVYDPTYATRFRDATVPAPPRDPASAGSVTIVGVIGGEVFGAAAGRAIDAADVLVGSPRHLGRFRSGEPAPERVELVGPLPPLLALIAARSAAGRRVCVLASGDPGFFGITRALRAHLAGSVLRIHPAPSSVSLAWAAAGLAWDDADVVSAHGRPLGDAVRRALRSPKVAVLTSPTNPPAVLGRELLAHGCGPRRVVVVSRIGESDERLVDTDLAGLAATSCDGLSVVLLVDPDVTPNVGSNVAPDLTSDVTPDLTADVGSNVAPDVVHEVVPGAPALSWGRSEHAFAHRAGMITKAEVRAIALGQLALPRSGVLWDVGAGSGSVGIEAATVAPGLRVCAVERMAGDAANIAANAHDAGVAERIDVVVGTAPEALADLPDPDRVFVGGGGLDVVRACWDRLPPGGVLVATFVLLDRAVAALDLLGEMIQVHVDRCVPIGTGMRLEPTNPVFVCRGRR